MVKQDTIFIILGIIALALVINNVTDLNLFAQIGNVRPTSQTIDPVTKDIQLTFESNTAGGIVPGEQNCVKVSPFATFNAGIVFDCGLNEGQSEYNVFGERVVGFQTACTKWCQHHGYQEFSKARGCWSGQSAFEEGNIQPGSTITATANFEFNKTLHLFTYTVPLSTTSFRNGNLCFTTPECIPFPQTVKYSINLFLSPDKPQTLNTLATCNVDNNIWDQVEERWDLSHDDPLPTMAPTTIVIESPSTQTTTTTVTSVTTDTPTTSESSQLSTTESLLLLFGAMLLIILIIK